jgi:hypothetical protein
LPSGGLEGKVIYQHPWLFKVARKVLSLFSSKELGTPLSFFAQLRIAVVTLAALGVFLVQPKERLELLTGAGGLLLVLGIIVAVIAWSRPQNLVFQTSGPRKISHKQNSSTVPILERGRPSA